jgi:hypothetical protein
MQSLSQSRFNLSKRAPASFSSPSLRVQFLFDPWLRCKANPLALRMTAWSLYPRPLFSQSYELLFPQAPCFDNHTNCRGCGDLYSPLVTRHFPFIFRSLPPLFGSLPSFPSPRCLFSITYGLFLQNTGGGGTPALDHTWNQQHPLYPQRPASFFRMRGGLFSKKPDTNETVAFKVPARAVLCGSVPLWPNPGALQRASPWFSLQTLSTASTPSSVPASGQSSPRAKPAPRKPRRLPAATAMPRPAA